jgi:hypothetical protein
MVTNLGFGIRVNPRSGLEREWITVHDSLLPLDLEDNVGVRTVYEGEYRYLSTYTVKARDSITAFEVRFVVFDIWGDPVRTLTTTEVQDIPAGATRADTGRWSVYSDNEVSEYYASNGFVARVRTKSGKVYAANMDPILAEATKFSGKFTAADLEARPQPPPSGVRR